MEEKNVTKISLSTFFLIFSILVIIVMGIFMFKFYNEKNEEVKKSAELQTQVNSLNGTVTNLQEKINSISETINSTEKQTNEPSKTEISTSEQNKTETSTSQSNKTETSKTDYSKYFGTWSDGSENEFTVRNIGNDLITFTWFIFRAASIDDVTLPFKDNKAVFYYHGFHDNNFNGKNEDDEFYCRKATVELKENSISVKVENSTLEESNKNMELDKTDLFNGGVWIEPDQWNFTTKK